MRVVYIVRVEVRVGKKGGMLWSLNHDAPPFYITGLKTERKITAGEARSF